MADHEDSHELPLDPSEWEQTELYQGDDPVIAEAIHEARTQIFDDVPLTAREVTVAPPAPRRWRSGLWIAGALAVGIGALMLVDRYAGSTASVAPDAAPAEERPAAAARPAADARPAAVAPADAAAADIAPADAAAELIPTDYTAAFRRSEPAVQRCLAEHGADAGEAEQLTLRFDIAADGTVERARVTPEAIAASELGRCLLEVARAARFAPQDQPVGIRIPLALRRR